MANIITKAYDATKKIVTSIFLGKPNLFTTADVNRYIEQTRAELDFLHRMVGFESDFSVSMTPSSGSEPNKTITTNYTYLRYKGISFSPSKPTFEHNFKDLKEMFLVLRAKRKKVTFADDSTHEVAGARFDDGTSMASADQIVLYDEKIVLVEDPNQGEIGYENVGTIGVFSPYINNVLDEYTFYRVPFRSNCSAVDSKRSLTNTDSTMESNNSSNISGIIFDSDSVQTAISKVKNNLKLIFRDSAESGFKNFGSVGRIRLIKGILHFHFPLIEVKVPSATDNRHAIVKYTLPDEYKNLLLDYYEHVTPYDITTELEFKLENKTGIFIPLSPASVVNEYGETPLYGNGSFGIFVEKQPDSLSNTFVDCYLVAYVYALVKFEGSTINGYGTGMPLSTVVIKGHSLMIQGASVAIPLMGYKNIG